ncbi:hypothetical protein NGB36_20110 [Streptomyces sp. RB6PN25]|uniref:Lipoprotein n=1 Tax=Streptomyces humicola TaxID=2953240 RepID=A0ABT1PYT2_9ACTN|nr:hypothetical protein [Streptomyces humicola]MCQ4082844.1 hypothetical protein [Streptomyces humicola]
MTDTGPTGSGAYTPSAGSSAGSEASAPSGVFLAAGACAARIQTSGGVSFREVACNDRSAVAKVTVRRTRGDPGEPDCPDVTDFVLAVQGGRAKETPSPTGTGTGTGTGASDGYACMRNLRPPHPGDPGGGGGPNTIVGDCVYDAGHNEVKETACDGGGSNGHALQYKVVAIVTDRAGCPQTTALYIGVRKGEVGCARRL